MFFQINVTPKEKKVASRRTENEGQEQEKCHKQQKEYTISLAPFQPPTRIELDTPVYNAVQCQLKIQNPTPKNLHVTVTKCPPKERSIELSAMEFLVEAKNSADLRIAWTPQECGSWRDTLQLTDSRRVKYDVALMTTAVGGRKGKSRVLAPSNSNKTLTTKARKLSPPLREPKKTAANTGIFASSNIPNKKPRLEPQPENKENLKKSSWTGDKSNNKQTHQLQNSQIHDFSAIINSTGFNLTPVNCNRRKIQSNPNVTVKTPTSIKFSPQESGILFPEITNPPILRRETYKVSSMMIQHQEDIKEEEENFTDSLSPQPPEDRQEIGKTEKANFQDPPPSDFSLLINDINFLTPKSPSKLQVPVFSPNGCSTGNRTKPIGTSFSSSAEGSPLILPGNDTFNVSGLTNAANNSQADGTYELLVSPTRSTDSIKPIRLAKNFETMSPIFDGRVSAAPTSTPLCFGAPLKELKECEYESVEKSICHNKTSRLSIYEGASVKEVLEADLWVKPEVKSSAFSLSTLKGRCSSVEEISEQPCFHSTFNSTRTLPSQEVEKNRTISKTRRIEISPPKKLSSCVKNTTIRRISPTKGTKIRKDKSSLEPVTSLRKKVQMSCSMKRGRISIPGVRIAKLDLSELRKSGREMRNKSVASTEEKQVVKLHDPDDFITRFCNPDPFAATITQDPFLTSTLYYDEESLYHQEMELKKWLNALLTPPEHLNADVETFRVDVGKVWQSCRSREDVALAETREAVSARYHTNTRLNTLRKAACAMYRREEVVSALSKVTVCVERGILIIRQDRDLHRDIGLQKEILELFLSYNPLWLRIGLETIYGETIPLNSNNDLVGLTKFLINRFFSDPFIVKNHSYANSTSLKMPTFNQHMNKFILKKFLFVVFFLDHAKSNKLIGHDPCLFHKKANHKESRAILLTFSREVLSGVGDVTKVLRSYGYVVSHKQTYLDEYDYAVKDITTDLRDGVRLCRVMELITGDRNLTSRCRVPAISRLQKVHNADVALTALLRCGYTLTGEIDAKSVADGHREKTLSLLWQIIYKYQAPRFEKAAKVVQKFWRAKLWYVRVRNFLRTRKFRAATIIQTAWRCYRARKNVQLLREERLRLLAKREKAVRVIQLRWSERMRMKKERRKFLLMKKSIVKIQRWYRTKKATASYVCEFRKKRQAVFTIQRHWRSFVLAKKLRNNYLELVRVTVKLQKLWRAKENGRKVRRAFEATKKSVTLVQSKWRALLAMRKDREAFQRKRKSAIIIQFWWRRILLLKRDRNSYLLMKHAVLTIENWWIIRRIVQSDINKFEKIRKSVITLQKAWRRYSQTKTSVTIFKEKRKAGIFIQQWWRNSKVARNQHYEFLRYRETVVFVQNRFRANKLATIVRNDYLAKKESAIKIQSYWRMTKQRRDFNQLIERHKAATILQNRWRANKLAKTIRNNYLAKKEATIKIQSYWRMIRERRDFCQLLRRQKAAMLLQNRWRENKIAKITRNDYLAKKESAIKIQSYWRMTKQRRDFNELLRRHKSVTILQNRWRANKLAKIMRNDYLVKKEATIKIQSYWRMTKQKRLFNQLLERHKAATILQNRWRANKLATAMRKDYLAKKEVTIKIQSYWRMTKQKRLFNQLLRRHKAVTILQNRWRANKLAKIVRNDYLAKKEATIKIQAYWRMIREKRHFYQLLRRHKAATLLQNRWRSNKLAKIMRNDYLVKKEATIKIQSYWRMTKQKRLFNQLLRRHKAVTILQNRWRANKLAKIMRNDYLVKKESATKIQAYWRMIREKRHFYQLLRRHKAATLLQNRWRATVKAKKLRTSFLALKNATVYVQRRFRANKAREIARQDYINTRKIIIRIQTIWREKLENRKRVKAAIRIQSWWISILAMRKCREQYEENKRIRAEELALLERQTAAARKIQKVWRGYKVRGKMCSILRQLKERAERAAKAALPSATVAFQMKESMDMLPHCNMVGQYLMCFTKIDTLTRMLPWCSVAFCERNLVDKIYETLEKANRSLPWMDLIVRCTSILITMSKLPDTKKYIYKVEYIETLARLMTITVERHPNLFLHLATLLWLLAENPDYAEAIRSCPRSTWLLNSLHNKIEKNKSRTSANNPNKSRSGSSVAAQLPNSKPDWGLKKQTRPRLFTTVHHAISSLMKRLKTDTAD